MSDTATPYEIITERMVAALEAGTVPWRQPWTGGRPPANLVSGKPYTGVNPFLLTMSGQASPWWLTFKQAKTLGGSVRKGERSTVVVFFKPYPTKDKDTGEPVTIRLLRYYRVFSLDQCEGVRIPAGRDVSMPEPRTELETVEAAEAIVRGYPSPPRIVEGDPQAYYLPAVDLINMPERSRFATAPEWYSTLFHEIGHSTGHKSRLGREQRGMSEPHAYGREELVAEMTSAFLCAEAGILNDTAENNAAYLSSWVRTITADSRAVVVAAGKAQRAADHVLGRTEAREREVAA